jgi:asparagine synthase (glutamine-hydrolysing)
MCGIFGSVGEMLSEAQQAAALLALRGRGPDSQGSWQDHNAMLLHTRLAIQDLSNLGNQPMTNRSEDMVLVFNGEIYNQLELRQELEQLGCRFHSHSDTEVILHGQCRWKGELWRRLNGIFAVAAWEPRQQRLTLARDGFGIKPLLWKTTENGCYFGSELSAFEACGLGNRHAVNPEALRSYSYWGAVAAPHTLLEGIEVFPAGCVGQWSPGKHWEITRFTDLNASTTLHEISNLQQAKDAVENALKRAVRRQAIGDVPVGIFLSGGLDSGLLAALLREQQGNKALHSISVGFADLPGAVDESELAESTANQLQLCHHTLRINRKTLSDSFDDFLTAIDQPSIDGFNSFLVARAASADGMTVAFSGLGADELFGGYGHMGVLPASALLKVRRIHGHGLAPREQQQLQQHRASLVPNLASELGNTAPARLANSSRLELLSYLQDTLLRDGDAVTMHHGLELRVPFLDPELVTLALAIPEALHRAEGPKTLLRRLAAQRLPKAVLKAPKRGFNLALAPWLQTSKRFQPTRIQALLSSQLQPQGLKISRRGLWSSWALLQATARWAPYWRWVVLAEWLAAH